MRQSARPATENRFSQHAPVIELTHGRAVWVFSALGFSDGVTAKTFNYYIKSLRKLGIPFVRGDSGLGTGRLARYSYNHLMELALALTLRVYGILPDPVVAGIIRSRQELYGLYRQAYVEAIRGLGAPVRVHVRGEQDFAMSGIYLDLQIRYVRGQILEFGPPQALSPFEAIRLFATTRRVGTPHVPLNLSALALDVVTITQQAPKIRRGRH